MPERSRAINSPLVAHALDRLRALLARPPWTGGGRLPAETALAREIGVSRPILRRALAVLRQEGIVESRRGSGNFVCGRADAPPAYDLPQTLADIGQCLRFRMVLESAAAAEAALYRDPPLLAGIEEAVRRLEACGLRDEAVFDADFAFHLAVAAASRNRYFAVTLELLRKPIEVGYMLGRRLRHVPPDLTSRRVIREHDAVLEAIRAGNAEAAAARMEDHLGAGIERLFGE